MAIKINPATQPTAPPKAPGLPFVGNMVHFLHANGIPIEYMQSVLQERGDLVHFTVMNQSIYLVGHPDLAQEVLLKRVNEFHKVETSAEEPRVLGRFLGQGILTADHDEWRPQRKLIQPLMHTKHITQYADTMARFGEQLVARWRDGEVRDIHAEMTQVTMWIIAETMFGTSVEQTPELDELVRSAQKIAVDDLLSPLPAWATPGRDRKAAALNDTLTALVERFVRERHAQRDVERHDLLALLMETRDEDGQPMPAEFIRNNILTLFFAGHETTANTLTWTFYYLDQHPEAAAELRREVDTVLGGRLPTLADLPHLPYTMMVIKETMRIQPIVAAIPRTLPVDTELGGFQLKAGSIVFVSPYVLHRDPRWWSQPEVFDPLRFTPENEDRIPKYAYLPFGGGPRICIGNHFSLMESQILLALIASRYKLDLVPGQKIEPVRQITSYPRSGLPMRLTQCV